MPEAELDSRLQRLIFLTDGVYAIALTLLAVELVLPEAAVPLHGDELLGSLLEEWPRVLGFLTSFTFIANYWVGQLMIFQHVRRFDGRLMWLTLLQLLCVAFIPFPTSVIADHVSAPVAQQFYYGTLVLTGLSLAALWWYASSGGRLVAQDLSPRVLRRNHIISLGTPMIFVVLMGLIAVGVGRLVNPLVLGYIVALFGTVMGALQGGVPDPPALSEPMGSEGPPAEEQTEGHDLTNG
jgi:uncharacterized membrane protein